MSDEIPRMIRYGRELRDPSIAGSREFLMVSGDMYCSSSFAGNTRRYHGLLVQKGIILLNGIHDEADGIRLSAGWWGDALLGEGLEYSTGAVLYPVQQEFALPKARIIRSFLLKAGLTIRYEVFGSARLLIRPLASKRPVHDLSRDPYADISEENGKLVLNGCIVTGDLPFTQDEQWYMNAYYPREQDRGYEAGEDLISPGFFSGIVTNRIVEISFTPSGPTPVFLEDTTLPVSDILDNASRLCWSGDQIHAGYHWFTESWGRDTFISLPGLLLETGRYREAEEVFRWHLAHRKDGIFINRYPDSYHTADATAWFFWALFQYAQKLPGSPFITTIRHEIEDILHQYPRSGIATLSGNLITVESRSTWMDTRFTPRNGKPVEINALWILMLEMAEFLKINPPVRSADARKEFMEFWNEESGCLYDLRDPDDPAIRSNQVIALALGLIPFDEGRRVLEVIQRDLLTPYGLRTLAPGLPGYYGKYAGDISYHNGMVWPWQTGFYVDALLQYGEMPEKVRSVISPLMHYLLTDGAGMLPELFDGDAPYQSQGAVCMAASIGELIRAGNRIRRAISESSGKNQDSNVNARYL
jgi:glycogen debranching enzyme